MSSNSIGQNVNNNIKFQKYKLTATKCSNIINIRFELERKNIWFRTKKGCEVLRKSQITDTEDMLKNYYRSLNELWVKKGIIKNLRKNAEEIRNILLDVNELVPSKGIVARYMAVSGGCMYVCDRTAQNYYEFTSSVEKFEKRLAALLHRSAKLKIQIIYLESAIEGITYVLSLLDPVDRTICEKCYGLKEHSNLQIAKELRMDEKTIRCRRKKINQKLSLYLQDRLCVNQ